MTDALEVCITGPDGVTRQCGPLAQSITWAGDVKNCARTLTLPLPVSSVDKVLPVVPCDMGSHIGLRLGGAVLFDGFVFGRDRSAMGDLMELTCVDRGLYLKRSEAAYKFVGLTPESITRRICGDYGIQVGALAETGAKITRNFPGVSLYKMIATAYSLAAGQTGERYAIRFRGNALEVVAKRQGAETLVIQPGHNLRDVAVSESVADMVNQVAIYDDSGALVKTQKDEEAIRLYGRMQAYLKQAKGIDAEREAQRLLEDNGVEQKITVTVNGNPTLMAGSCAVLREPVTGLCGLFWIDSDTHVWTKDGDYQTKLILNFRNMMDMQEAGSLPKA